MGEFSFYAAQIIDGIAYGTIYGILALSIVILYRANKLFNFAQTEIAMLFVCLTLGFMKIFPMYVAIIIVAGLSFLGGACLHLLLMRFVTERRNIMKSHESVITICLFTFFNSLNSYLFGDDPRPFPSPFGERVINLNGITIPVHTIGILTVSFVLVLLIYLGFKFTKTGLIFEAVAENIEAARLRGFRASNILALAWGFTVMTSALGGILIAPVLFVSPSMLISVYVYSLIAVVIGGMESPLGAVLGGIIVGVLENLASNASFIGSDLKFVAITVFLVLVLLFKPRGFFGRLETRKV